MEKYGFIYLWFDRKERRYYLGRHWGHISDGYISSSKVMKSEYKQRPFDFKRRVVKIVYDKNVLISEEQRFLDFIKPEECGVRYYNTTLKSNTPSMRGRKHSVETIEKIRFANKGKIRSEETKNKIRISSKKQFEDMHQREMQSQRIKELWNNPEYRSNQIEKKKRPRKALAQETRKKISDSHKGKKHTEETRKKISDSHKGKKHTENFKIEMSLRNIGNKYGSVPRSQEFKENASRKMKEYWRKKNAICVV